jgi:hypothetical protein
MNMQIIREHKTKANEIIDLVSYDRTHKPYAVVQYDSNDDLRWEKEFATEQEALDEFNRWITY